MIDSPDRLIRTFIAIELPKNIQVDLSKYIHLIDQQNIPRLRTIKHGSAHITIKFLGQVRSSDIPLIEKVIEEKIVGFESFTLSISAFKLHPDFSNPRFAYFDVASSIELMNLKGMVEESCNEFGFHIECLKWLPHITVARISRTKTRAERRSIGEKLKIFPPFGKIIPASQISIMSSELSKSGPTYNTLGRIELLSRSIN